MFFQFHTHLNEMQNYIFCSTIPNVSIDTYWKDKEDVKISIGVWEHWKRTVWLLREHAWQKRNANEKMNCWRTVSETKKGHCVAQWPFLILTNIPLISLNRLLFFRGCFQIYENTIFYSFFGYIHYSVRFYTFLL